jgi:hypothetical protein
MKQARSIVGFRTRTILSASAAGVVAFAAAGGTLSVDIPSIADNTLYENATGAVSNGAGQAMFAGRNAQSSNSRRRGLVRFDVGSLVPAGATITGATLRLYQDSANTEPRGVTVHRVLEGWGEGTSNAGGGGGSGAASTAGDATWIHTFFSGTTWSTPGGVFSAAASATTSVGGTGFWEWSSPGLIADVQGFMDQPGQNFGWLLRGDESAASSAKRFFTREAAAEFRPVLIVTYIPGPGSAAGLLVAGVAGACRRRRR